MAILNRFTRLFKADVHAMLDQLEEPESLLKQALREMEEEVRKQSGQVKLLEQQTRQNQARISELSGIVKEIEAQLDLCFEADNTVLARSLIRRRLENQRLADALKKQLAGQSEELNKHRELIRQRQQKLGTLRQQAAIFDARREKSCYADLQGMETLSTEAGLIITDQDVEIALLEEQKRRSK